MSLDKLVDSSQLDTDLTSVANAIRTKGGTSGQLAFPSGFVSAVQAIPTGGSPTGTKQISITANGTTTEDVANYANAEITVNVSGGGGASFDWADVTEITIGANSVTNTSGVQSYFAGTASTFYILKSGLTRNNQFVLGFYSAATSLAGVYRYRGGSIVGVAVGNTYDCVLVEGSVYYKITKK